MNHDMTFCTGKSCPQKDKCRRYMEQPIGDKYISRFVRIPYDTKSKSCKHFLPTHEDNTMKTTIIAIVFLLCNLPVLAQTTPTIDICKPIYTDWGATEEQVVSAMSANGIGLFRSDKPDAQGSSFLTFKDTANVLHMMQFYKGAYYGYTYLYMGVNTPSRRIMVSQTMLKFLDHATSVETDDTFLLKCKSTGTEYKLDKTENADAVTFSITNRSLLHKILTGKDK